MTPLKIIRFAALALMLSACASAPKQSPLQFIPETNVDEARQAAIVKTLESKQSQYLACYKNLQSRAPTPELRFTAELKILESGRVGFSRVHETSTQDPSFQACMLSHINGLKFGAMKEPLTVRYPFSFEKK